MFGIDDAILGSIAGPVIGGLLGGSGAGQASETNQRQIDPRVKQSVFNPGGLLDDVDAYRKQQLATGGLNSTQLAGLEMNRQLLTDPGYSQGYNQMRSLGMSLMGGGVAANPFTQGGQPNFTQSRAQTGMPNYQAWAPTQNESTVGAYQPIRAQTVQSAPVTTPKVDDVQAIIDEWMKKNGYSTNSSLAYNGNNGDTGGY